MANKITYPIVGGTIKNMKGDADITAGMYVAVTADNTVDEATGVVHGIVLDTPKASVSPSTSYTVSVLLFGNSIIKAPTDLSGITVGNYLKGAGGVLADDTAALTIDSIALLIDATNSIILIL